MSIERDDSDQLKPCANCGGYGEVSQMEDGGYFIQCTTALCGMSTCLMYACGEDPVPILMEKWNRRASAAPVAPTEPSELQAFADKVRGGIANHLSDNMPMRRYNLAEIEGMIRAVEIRAHLLAPRPLVKSTTKPSAPQVDAPSEPGRAIFIDPQTGLAVPLPSAWQSRNPDDESEFGNCNVCGGPLRYGERHLKCGDAIMKAEKAAANQAAPVAQPDAPSEPVAWWRISYIDDEGHSDADVQIGKNKPTEMLLQGNGFEWEPLYAAPVAQVGDARRIYRAATQADAFAHAAQVDAPPADSSQLRDALQAILPMAEMAADYLPAEAADVIAKARAALAQAQQENKL